MKENSFMDPYFGEWAALGREVVKAPGIKIKFLYKIMPRGWSHTGEHKMAHVIRQKYLEETRAEPLTCLPTGLSDFVDFSYK